jgi:hypothetical protein
VPRAYIAQQKLHDTSVAEQLVSLVLLLLLVLLLAPASTQKNRISFDRCARLLWCDAADQSCKIAVLEGEACVTEQTDFSVFALCP